MKDKEKLEKLSGYIELTAGILNDLYERIENLEKTLQKHLTN